MPWRFPWLRASFLVCPGWSSTTSARLNSKTGARTRPRRPMLLRSILRFSACHCRAWRISKFSGVVFLHRRAISHRTRVHLGRPSPCNISLDEIRYDQRISISPYDRTTLFVRSFNEQGPRIVGTNPSTRLGPHRISHRRAISAGLGDVRIRNAMGSISGEQLSTMGEDKKMRAPADRSACARPVGARASNTPGHRVGGGRAEMRIRSGRRRRRTPPSGRA